MTLNFQIQARYREVVENRINDAMDGFDALRLLDPQEERRVEFWGGIRDVLDGEKFDIFEHVSHERRMGRIKGRGIRRDVIAQMLDEVRLMIDRVAWI